MKVTVLLKVIEIFLNTLTPELVEKFADWVLDFIEEHVEGSISTIDDRLILPICSLIRTTFDIKD